MAMRLRCSKKTDISYKNYGAKGVTVYPEWQTSFAAFLRDVGPRPSMGHTLDRYPNKKGNYEPGNVRWATWIQQSNGRSNNRIITWNGKSQTMADWAREYRVPYQTVRDRIRYGWTLERALTESIHNNRGRARPITEV